MNREFKFRVWDIVNKDFTYSPNRHFLIGLGGDLFDGSGASYEENHIIQQFTGLKDKNGKEIYEGDILKAQEHTYDFTKGNSPTGVKDIFLLCEYDETGARFLINFYPKVGCGGYDFHNGMQSKIEVIGNIFQNPELLKKP